jgi:deazaflavin-dependent oxidoreductase (nitroreductase family)
MARRDASDLYGAEHVRQYRATDGEYGHDWRNGSPTLLLTTTGRTSGQEREVIIGYLEDGPDLVAIAMNGWDEGDPAWWLNLKAHREATIQRGGVRTTVHARRLTENELDAVWPKLDQLNRLWRHTTTVTDRPLPVIALEPSPNIQPAEVE